MAKGIEIGIGADTKAFKQGVDVGLIAPIEDAVDKLEEFGRSNAPDAVAKSLDEAGEAADALGKSRGPDDLERGLEDAQEASQRLERESKDAARTIDTEFKRSYKSLKDNSDRAVRDAKEGLTDLKSESGSVARETAASFDGSADSIAGAFQEAAANSFVGFGPAGAVAGAAAAVGIGLAGAAMAANEAAAAEMATATANAFDAMIEAGGKYYTKDAENAQIAEALKDPEKSKEILEIAKLTGLAEGDVARAVALSGEERDKTIEKLAAVYEANNQLQTQGEGFTEQYASENAQIAQLIEKLEVRNSADASALDLLKIYDDATGNVLKKREQEKEEIRARNKALANTPAVVNTKLKVDDSELRRTAEKEIQVRVKLNVGAGKYGRFVV